MILTISIPITFKKSSSSQPNQRIIVVGFLPFFLILINICQELSYNKVVLCSAAYQVNAHKSHKKVGGVQNPWCIVWTKKVFFFNCYFPKNQLIEYLFIYINPILSSYLKSSKKCENYSPFETYEGWDWFMKGIGIVSIYRSNDWIYQTKYVRDLCPKLHSHNVVILFSCGMLVTQTKT